MKTTNNPCAGAEFLRDLVIWLNNRDEFLNDNKSPLTLIAEYRKYCKKFGIN